MHTFFLASLYFLYTNVHCIKMFAPINVKVTPGIYGQWLSLEV